MPLSARIRTRTLAALALVAVGCAAVAVATTRGEAGAAGETAVVSAPVPAKMAPDTAAGKAIRADIAKRFGAQPANVRDTPIPGLYEVSEGTEVLYVSADGQYMLSGQMFELASRRNLTDARKAGIRKTLLAAVRDEDTIPFLAAKPKYELYVFTDVDCGYCRRLHGHIAELNGMGISIRYLAFPRSGPGTESARKVESVWCSTNRQQALTSAKTGAAVATGNCKNPVKEQYELGAAVGLEGTPALYTKDGMSIRNGAPEEILAQLQQGG
jgi:thiol:disulfide interchange protein DsbC